MHILNTTITCLLAFFLSAIAPASASPCFRSDIWKALIHINQTTTQLSSRCAPFHDIHSKYFGPFVAPASYSRDYPPWPLLSEHQRKIAALEQSNTIDQELRKLGSVMREMISIHTSATTTLVLCDPNAFLSWGESTSPRLAATESSNLTAVEAARERSTTSALQACHNATRNLQQTLFTSYKSTLEALRLALNDIIDYYHVEQRSHHVDSQGICKPYVFQLSCELHEREGLADLSRRYDGVVALRELIGGKMGVVIRESVAKKSEQLWGHFGLKAAEETLAEFIEGLGEVHDEADVDAEDLPEGELDRAGDVNAEKSSDGELHDITGLNVEHSSGGEVDGAGDVNAEESPDGELHHGIDLNLEDSSGGKLDGDGVEKEVVLGEEPTDGDAGPEEQVLDRNSSSAYGWSSMPWHWL